MSIGISDKKNKCFQHAYSHYENELSVILEICLIGMQVMVSTVVGKKTLE